MENKPLSAEELKLAREKIKVLFNDVFGTSFFRIVEFHAVEDKNIVEELIKRPRYTYENIVGFFKDEKILESMVKIMDNKIYEAYRVSGLISILVNATKNDDRDEVLRVIKRLSQLSSSYSHAKSSYPTSQP